MTKIVLIGDITVYTELGVAEVRSYMQKGIKTKSFKGYLNEEKTKEILISATSILYVVV